MASGGVAAGDGAERSHADVVATKKQADGDVPLPFVGAGSEEIGKLTSVTIGPTGGQNGFFTGNLAFTGRASLAKETRVVDHAGLRTEVRDKQLEMMRLDFRIGDHACHACRSC